MLQNGHIAPSEQTFARSIMLAPKALAALVPVSDRLLRDAVESPDAARVIEEDLPEIMALRGDVAFVASREKRQYDQRAVDCRFERERHR